MSDTLTIIGGAAALAIVVGIALALALRRRRMRRLAAPESVCPECGAALPRGVSDCHACAQTPPPTPRPLDGSPGPALVGLAGPLEGQVFPISPSPGGLTIGRHPDNDLTIVDVLAVSRYHAQIVPEADCFVLYDRNSANGTVVNGRRVFRHELGDGDQIEICGVRLAFSVSGTTPPEPSEAEDPPAPVSTPSLEPMERIDDCVVEEVLGHGGMSIVYRGHDAQGQPVAIKVLNVTDDYIVRKFVQEQQIGEMLGQHPYIRSVTRLGRAPQGNLFLVMEYVDGCSLRRLVGQLSESDIVRIIGQCCVALAYAHDMRIVHRDIKPENILIDREGTVKLTDFGIAKLTSSVTMTTGRIVGTPEYLSPEQARGNQRVGPASDVYSMGIVLYELLTGQVPFPLPRGESSFEAAVTVLRQHISTPPPAIRERNPDTPKRLEKVALRALDKNPKKRYRTAAAMGKALGYDGEPVVAGNLPGPRAPIGLVIVRGGRRGHQIIVTGDDVTIGRADLDPGDAGISRRHAILSIRGDQLWIEDISLNGTSINGERIFGEAPLRVGDRVEIAGCLLAPLEPLGTAA